jgi:hypothetical protein
MSPVTLLPNAGLGSIIEALLPTDCYVPPLSYDCSGASAGPDRMYWLGEGALWSVGHDSRHIRGFEQRLHGTVAGRIP